MRAHLGLLLLVGTSGCIFRWPGQGFDKDEDRPDDSYWTDDSDDTDVNTETDTDIETDVETDVDTGPRFTCPPELPIDATVTNGRAAISRDIGANDNIDDMLALLACCVPSDLEASQGLGHYEIDVQGTTSDGLCAYGLLIEEEQGWTRYGCRSTIPVAVPDELSSPLSASGAGDTPDCVNLGSGGPL